jgi:hypothetical protein
MRSLLAQPLVQIALWLAVYALIGWKFGPFGLVIAAPGLAAFTVRPIWHIVAGLREGIRERVWLPVHGEHFSYKSTTIHVLEDDSHFRWVCLADVRKVIAFNASDGALTAAHGALFQRMGKPAQPYLRDDALLAHLGKSTQEPTQRFRTWVERTVAMPGGRVRERLGVRAEAD